MAVNGWLLKPEWVKYHRSPCLARTWSCSGSSTLGCAALFAALVVAAAAAGCRCPPPIAPGPEAAWQQYKRALADGDPKAAMERMSERAREKTSEETIRRFVSQDKKRLASLLSAVSEIHEMELALSGGELAPHRSAHVRLLWERGEWRVDSGSLVPMPGFTPEAAVDEFLTAIENGDCAALLACAPPDAVARHPKDQLLAGCRERLASLREIASKVRRAQGKLLMESEHRAVLPYQEDLKLVVEKQNDRWFVGDL